MKKLLLFILILFILIVIAVYHNNNSSRFVISRLVENEGLRAGDLRYSASLLGVFPVGKATIRTEKPQDFEGKRAYHLSASAMTHRLFERFFKASVELDSFVDIQSKDPMAFNQKVLISGKPDLDRQVRYDQEKGVMTREGVERMILPNTHDPLSLFYNLKKMDFDRVKDIEMSINTGKKNYVLKGKVTQNDIIIDKKLYKTFTLDATVKRREKSPYHSSSINIVFIKEGENIPVLIKVVASGILINARLTGSE